LARRAATTPGHGAANPLYSVAFEPPSRRPAVDSDLIGAYFTMLAVLFFGLAAVAIALVVWAARFAARRLVPSRLTRRPRLSLLAGGTVLFLLLMIPVMVLTVTLAFSW
jgi:glucan phosphoethanolaminetransferase (alkaline phosphatase superfamily)